MKALVKYFDLKNWEEKNEKMKKNCICVVFEICEGLWGFLEWMRTWVFIRFIYIYMLICKLSC